MHFGINTDAYLCKLIILIDEGHCYYRSLNGDGEVVTTDITRMVDIMKKSAKSKE